MLHFHECVEMHNETRSMLNRTENLAWLILLEHYDRFPSTICNIWTLELIPVQRHLVDTARNGVSR